MVAGRAVKALARWGRRALLGLASLLILILIMMTVPLEPFGPYCNGQHVWGKPRQAVIDASVRYLEDHDVYYWKIGSIILVRALPFFDGGTQYDMDDLGHLQYNFWLKLARYENGLIEIGGTAIPASPKVERLSRELDAWTEAAEEVRQDGTRVSAYQTWERKVYERCAAMLVEPRPGEE
jgi:hypothetical protein